MYISNSSNIGMATLLQQNKNCMKTLTNGGGNIIVGNVVTATAPPTSNSSVTATTLGVAGASTLAGNIVVPAQQTSAILLTNGATGANNILNFQQYQQLVQQQHQQQQQSQQQQQQQHQSQSQQHQQQQQGAGSSAPRLLMPHEMVSLPIGNIVTTGTGGLAVIAGNAVTATTQGAFLVAAAAPTATSNSSGSSISSFQQQFQQQIAAATGNGTGTQQQSQQQQQQNHHSAPVNAETGGFIVTGQPLRTLATSTVNIGGSHPRQYSQFNHQSPALKAVSSSTTTGSAGTSSSSAAAAGASAPSCNSNAAAHRPTHVLINRSNNTIINSNTMQRLQHATFLGKPPVARATATATAVGLVPRQLHQFAAKSQRNTPSILLPAQHTQFGVPRFGVSSVLGNKQQVTKTIYIPALNNPSTTVTVMNGGGGSAANPSGLAITIATAAATPTAPIPAPTRAPPATASASSSTSTSATATASTATSTASPSTISAPTSTSTSTMAPAHSVSNGNVSSTSAVATTSQSSVPVSDAMVSSTTVSSSSTDQQQEPEPEIDIVINNVVCSFSVRCHLNLREIALNGFNVEYRRENGMVTMKLRRPYTTASIWSSGRITCTGATSEDQAKIAARRYARCLQKLGFRIRFHNFRVVNVLGTCSMPWAIKIVNFSEKYKKDASYEPELHPGVTYKLRFPKATLKIFSTGSITVTAASVANVQAAIEHIFPLVYEFRKKRSPEELEQLRLKLQRGGMDEVVETEETLTEDEPTSVPVPGLPKPRERKRGRPTAAAQATSSSKSKRKKSLIESDDDLDGDEENIDDPDPLDDDRLVIYSEYEDLDDLIEGPEDDDDDL